MEMMIQLQPKNLIDSIVAPFCQELSKKSITLSIKIASGVPEYFHSDKAKLTQILSALSDYAIQRNQNGSITVQLKSVDAPAACKQCLEFSVEDNGIMPDVDCIEKILDTDIPVADWPKDHSHSELSMSLRMAAKLVEILGGKLQLQRINSGTVTRFSFSIPVKLADEQAAAVSPKQNPGVEPAVPKVNSEPDFQVLIVDDVPENRMLVELLIKKMGHQTRLAVNGQEAVDCCKKEKFGVILMDIQMPVLDGLEAIRQIRAEGLNTQTMIIAMTASDNKVDDFAALDAGCDDCLNKPVDRAKLERKISRIAAQFKQIKDAEEGRAIVSFLEGDSHYQKAIECFIDTLPVRVNEIKSAYQKGDIKDLVFKVHSLKGVGGMAGFPVFTEKAKMIEKTIKTSELDKLQYQVDELVALCLRTKHKDQAHL